MMKKIKYKLIFNGEEQDGLFDSRSEAKEHALYLCSCTQLGSEILHMSNPGDYDDDYEEPEYEIVSVTV